MNFVSRLCDDDLQVQIGHARHGNGLRSGAVRIHEVDAGPGPPTGSEVAVRRDRINLRLAPFSVKGFLRYAINQQGRTVRKEYRSMDGKGVAASDSGIIASTGMGG